MSNNNVSNEDQETELLGAWRTIEFYHLTQRDADAAPFSVDDFVAKISAIDKKDRWVRLDNRERFDCWYEGKGEYLHKFRIGITRSKVRDRRLDTKTGDTGHLELKEHEEISVNAHLLIFPTDNIVGFEFVPVGPTLNQFSDFIKEKMGDLGVIKFEVAANRNFQENLDKVSKFNQLSLTITEKNFWLYEIADPNYARSAMSGKADTGAGKMRITYFANRQTSNDFNDFAKGWALKISKVLKAEPKMTEEQVFKDMQMKFRGPDNEAAVKRSIIDLTCSKITALKHLTFSQPISKKHIDPDAAFKAIREAYDSVLPELRKSIGIDLED